MPSAYAERIEELSMCYEHALRTAVSLGDSPEALDSYIKAATAQYELSGLTTGIAAEKHRNEMKRLLTLVRDEVVRRKIVLPEKLIQWFTSMGITFPAMIAEGSAEEFPEHPAAPVYPSRLTETAKVKTQSASAEDLHGFDIEAARITELPSASFEDFGNMEDSVQAIKDCFDSAHRRLEYPELAKQMPPEMNHILLYGPPGGGKTHFCKAIGNYVLNNFRGSTFYLFKASIIKHSLVGVAEKRLDALFADAAQYEMPVICIDEIDTLCPQRDVEGIPSHERALVTEFLQHIDGVGGASKAVIIGATNYPWKVDSALRSRLATAAYVGLPSEQQIGDYLYRNLRTYLGEDEEFAKSMIALCTERLEHASYRELKWIVSEAARISFNRTTSENPTNKKVAAFVPIAREDMLNILSRVNYNYDAAYMQRLQNRSQW